MTFAALLEAATNTCQELFRIQSSSHLPLLSSAVFDDFCPTSVFKKWLDHNPVFSYYMWVRHTLPLYALTFGLAHTTADP